MINRALEPANRQPPLVLLVDSSLTSRPRQWIERRPDVDAIVVQDELPDERGLELVRELATARHPIAARSIVLARRSPDWGAIARAGLTLVERGDVRTVVTKLAGWFFARDASLAKALIREAERLRA